MESICVAVLVARSARRGAKVDAGTSDERRNDAVARENATRMGRALFARGFVERLARRATSRRDDYPIRASPFSCPRRKNRSGGDGST